METVKETQTPEELFAAQVAEAGLGSEADSTPVQDSVGNEQAQIQKEEPATETPVEAQEAEEFFPGYKSLPEESKALVRESMELARKAQEYQQAAGKSEADRRATMNRIVPVQREIEDLRAKLREFEKSKENVSRNSAKSVLERFKEQYPEEAEALEAVNSQFESFAKKSEAEKADLIERLSRLENDIHLQRQEIESKNQYESEVAALRELHPDYLEIDADPEFKAWLQAVGDEVMPLLRNGKASSTAFVLSNFKRDREYARQLGGAVPNTPAKKPLARSVADPNPTIRRTTALAHSNPASSLDGEDKFSVDLDLARAAGFNV